MASKHFALIIFIVQIIAISCKRYGSLSLVIDDTASMAMEIRTVTSESSKFMDTILTKTTSQISDVVIVTFNDPEQSNLRLKPTKDRNAVKNALNKIKVSKGYDCPEYSLAGINTALIESHKNSYLFVFTDASPKDGYVSTKTFRGESWTLDKTLQVNIKANLIKLARSQESQIFFFLTKPPRYCRESKSLYQPYWDIAEATNGQVFKIDEKIHLEKFLNYMNIIISGEGNLITRQEIKTQNRVTISFPVDDQTQYVMISVSTQGDTVDLDISSGPTRDYEKIAWTKNNKILKINSPAPGKYAVAVKGSDASTIMVVGRTDFTFQHGFSDTIPPTFSNERSQPIDGEKSYLLVKVDDPTNIVDIKSAQIFGLDEKTILLPSLTLNKVSNGYYATEKIPAPKDAFIITVIGEGKKTGETIKRTSKTPIQPRPQNLDPVISIQGGGKHKYNTSVSLTCYVKAYPKPEITWTDDKGNTLAALPTKEKGKKDFVRKILINNLKHKTILYCNAETDKGKKNNVSVDLDTHIPFKVHENPSEASTVVEFGTPATLQCDITADIPMDIVWYHITKDSDYKKLNNSPGTNSGYSISNHGAKLTIDEINQENEGHYICEALIRDDQETKYQLAREIIIKHTAPIIEILEYLQIKEDESKNLSCTIKKGYPKPKITWEFKDYRGKIFRPVHETGELLQINKANHLSAGVYKCIASNDMGKKERETKVTVSIRPKTSLVVNNETRIQIEYNKTEETALTCYVISHSLPVIVWKNGKNEIMTHKTEAIKNNGYEYISKMIMSQIKNSETYHCEAMNQISTTKSNNVYIDVINPFTIVPTGLDNNIIKVNNGDKSVISCGITAHWPIKITWYRETGEVVQASDKYLITENGAVLTIKKVGLDTRGKYICKASIIGDEATQKTHDTTVNIILEKPQVETKHRVLEVDRNHKALLKCNVLKGFPKPTITWMVKYEKTSEFVLLPNVGEELSVMAALYHHAGLYKCVLKNDLGSDEGTINLHVKGPPKILTDEDRLFTAVVGDDVLVIPCDVAGYPKPNITWRSQYPSSTKFHVNSNGSLVIKNPTENDSDKKYVCTATNEFDKDEKIFDTFVSETIEYDQDLGDITHIVVLKGTPKPFQCEFGSLKGRWFKNNEAMEETGTLIIDSVPEVDDGNYTCRISDSTGSKSYTYIVEIQYKPILKDPEEVPIDWDGSKSLSCDVSMQPMDKNAKAKWYYNGKESYLSYGEPHQSKHPIISWGNYTCNISNIHGFVVKNFQVYSSRCLINMNLTGVKYPLMLNTMGSWPKSEAYQKHYLVVESTENLLLSCNNHPTQPNFFQALPNKNEIMATCDHEDKFRINEKIFKISDLQCNTEVTPTFHETGVKCYNDNTELINVGYTVPQPESNFIEVYSVCFDKSEKVPIYANLTVTQHDNDRVENPIWLKYNNYYKEKTGEYCAKDNKCCLNKEQLVNERDVAKGPVKLSTFIDGLNSVPYWRDCNAVDMTWSDLDDKIQSFRFGKLYTKISGALGYTSRNGMMVPKYLWMIVKKHSLSLAIVMVNDPSPTKEDILCAGRCPWSKKEFKNTYCCKVTDFMKAFNVSIPGV